MLVKIGNTIYDSKDQPIMVILSDMDKQNISNMAEHYTKYCCFPENSNVDEIEKFMEVTK